MSESNTQFDFNSNFQFENIVKKEFDKMSDTTISLRIDKNLDISFNSLCEELNISKSAFIREAINEKIKEYKKPSRFKYFELYSKKYEEYWNLKKEFDIVEKELDNIKILLTDEDGNFDNKYTSHERMILIMNKVKEIEQNPSYVYRYVDNIVKSWKSEMVYNIYRSDKYKEYLTNGSKIVCDEDEIVQILKFDSEFYDKIRNKFYMDNNFESVESEFHLEHGICTVFFIVTVIESTEKIVQYMVEWCNKNDVEYVNNIDNKFKIKFLYK
jgi:antitoxin component of RelBE/YafQ-DinJ toxin-antitoxin module